MKITIEVTLDNAAFYDGEDNFNSAELTRILSKIGPTIGNPYYDALDKRGDSCSLRDYNGNLVGKWTIEPRPHKFTVDEEY